MIAKWAKAGCYWHASLHRIYHSSIMMRSLQLEFLNNLFCRLNCETVLVLLICIVILLRKERIGESKISIKHKKSHCKIIQKPWTKRIRTCFSPGFKWVHLSARSFVSSIWLISGFICNISFRANWQNTRYAFIDLYGTALALLLSSALSFALFADEGFLPLFSFSTLNCFSGFSSVLSLRTSAYKWNGTITLIN